MTRETASALMGLGLAAGGSRDDEAEPIDLRGIPSDRWEEYLCFPVLLPPDVAQYIYGMDSPTPIEKDHLEQRLLSFHGVTAPFTIVLRAGKARLMRG